MAKVMRLEIASNSPQSGNWLYAGLDLPAEEHEIRDAFQRARITGDETYREYTIYECDMLPMIEAQRLDSPTIHELNFLAQRMESLNEDERVVFQALAPKFIQPDEESIISVKDLINLTYGLDDVMVAHNVNNPMELGQFVIENELNEVVVETPVDARQFLDKRILGQLQQEVDGGIFLNGKYIVAGDYELREIYNGQQLPGEDLYSNYAFRLELANAPEGDDGIGTELPTRWLSLPTDAETAQSVAEELGANRIEDCVYLGFESTIPQIEADHFGDMHDFEKLNNLAQMMLELAPTDQAKFKAILVSEEPTKIEDILDVAKNLHQYEFAPQVEDAEQFFKSYLQRHLDTRFDPKWLDTLLLRNEGHELLEKLGGTITDYGVVSARGGSLYEIVPRQEPEQTETLEQDEKKLTIGGIK